MKRFAEMARNGRGSFTIEASLVYPLIILCTVMMIAFSLYVYQKVQAVYFASITAERLADNWDNSHKDPITGQFPVNSNDGLYWRISDDEVFSLFGISRNDSAVQIQLPLSKLGSKALSSSGLSFRKLYKAAETVPSGYSGSITYTNRLIERKVTVRLVSALKIPAVFRQVFGEGTIVGEAASFISEPVEFIRGIELVREYTPAVKDKISVSRAKTIMKDRDAAVDKETKETKQTPLINSHAEAADYLRRLVNGFEKMLQTSIGQRLVDALDPDGIAHQAFYTYREKQLELQMNKDAELIRLGMVKGVIWHFFKNSKSGRNGPSAVLRLRLSSHGINIVIHE
jgi:hypothetical protein